jgi:rhamnosyltransferase
VKRKFFSGFKGLQSPSGNLIMDFHAKRLMDFLKKNAPDITDHIWDDLLKTQHLSTINDHLNLNIILSSSLSAKTESYSSVAVIIYICAEDVAGYCFHYAHSIPEYVDIVIVNESAEVHDKCEKLFEAVPNKVIYRIQKNSRGDNATLLVTCRDIIKNYDYICFVHGEKSQHYSGADFREHSFLSLLYSLQYVENIIEAFLSEPRLGFLMPFTVTGGPHCFIANEWKGNYDNAKEVLKKYFNMDEKEIDPHPSVPLGGMFWCRTSALKTLTNYDWQYEDFPEYSLGKKNGLLPHVIERLMPRLAQNDGFYSAFVAPDNYASFYMGHLYFINREMKTRLFAKVGTCADLELLGNMNNLHNDFGDFSYWKEHRVKLEWEYLCCKLLRLVTIGDARRHYKAEWLKFKFLRRVYVNHTQKKRR